MRVTFGDNQNEVELDRACVRQLVKSLARLEKAKGGELSLVFVDDSYIRELSSRYLGVRRATDVLAFPMGEAVGPDDQRDLLGEVYVSAERAVAQARRYRVGLSEEIARLIVHGVLHLLGYRDDTPSSRRGMIRRQEAFLRDHRALAATVAKRVRSSG